MKYLILAPLALTAIFSQDLTQKELYNKECVACHKNTNEGTYSERNIYIPNFEKWGDD